MSVCAVATPCPLGVGVLFVLAYFSRYVLITKTDCEQHGMQVRAHPAVAHALRVRQALVFSQFPAFFKLYATAPNLGRALMDMCFSRVRFAALETVVDSFKGTKVKVLYVASVLGFLVKLGGEAGCEGQPAVVSEDTTVDVDAHSAEGGILLPGCAKTIHMGKHPAQVGNIPDALHSTALQTVLQPCIMLYTTALACQCSHGDLSYLSSMIRFSLGSMVTCKYPADQQLETLS